MPRTIALAYSGGLDTSIIVPWLKERYAGVRVVCVAADVGQGDDMNAVRAKALASGADACYVEDLRRELVESFIWPTLRAGAVYNRKYLLGTSVARPLIAKRQVEVARQVGADALAHGCTGKGNDQVRFELTYMAFAPDLPVIAPGASGASAAARTRSRTRPGGACRSRRRRRRSTRATRTCGTCRTRAAASRTRTGRRRRTSSSSPLRRPERPTSPSWWPSPSRRERRWR
jgi:hypothetical protein